MKTHNYNTKKASASILCHVFLALLSIAPNRVFAIDPVNPNASQATKHLLTYLDSFTNGKAEGVLVGQFYRESQWNEIKKKYDREFLIMTEEYVAGWDQATPPAKLVAKARNRVNPLAIAHHNRGGIVSIMMHPYNPKFANGGNFKEPCSFTEILNPGPTRDRYFAMLDEIAVGLQELEDKGVPILWRPFHEPNLGGRTFWWAGQSRANYIAVWREMYNYFTDVKGLDNLLWVYNSHVGDAAHTVRYPGDDYVDVITMDSYHHPLTASENLDVYKQLRALSPTKPFGIAECRGASGMGWVNGIKKLYPDTSFIVSWHDKFSWLKASDIDQVVADPSLIWLGDTPLTPGSAVPTEASP